LWFSGFAFPIPTMTRDVGDHGDFAALCLRPSASTPHFSTFIANKALVQFDPRVTQA